MYIMHPSLSLEEQEREKEMFHRFLKSSNIEMDELAVVSSSVIDAILKEAEKHDLVVMGASAATNHSLFGKIPEAVARSAKTTVIVVKKKDRIGLRFLGWPIERSLSVMVDKWFAENTFHHIEFKDIESLCRLKEKRGVKISLALPTKNEARTIGKVVETIKLSLMEEHQLVDEIVVIDARSKDRTVEIAKSLGIPVYFSDEILKPYGDFGGKGEALWKSLYVLKGDIIVWIDTDIKNIHPKFVYGLIGPLLKEERIKYVKGFYRRPLKVKGGLLETGGGRVTEISVRPLLNLFFPELSGLIQPLSGEYAGRREILESLPFFCGYGVEIGLLIDIFKRYGLNAIAQVDLEKRIHRNQPLVALSMMSFGIIQAILKRLKDYYGMDVYSEINKGMKLIHYEPERYFLKIREIEEKERLPIIEIPEYRGR
jgi:glucosyl-3-phosphoglycerate synthase